MLKGRASVVISTGFGPGPRSNRYRQCVNDDKDDDDDDDDDDGDDDDDDYDDDDDDDGLRWSVETGTKGRLWRMSAAHLILCPCFLEKNILTYFFFKYRVLFLWASP